MKAIALYRRMERMRRKGLSETEIGVCCGVRQWTVSRVLRLGGLAPMVARLFARRMASLSALVEIASWPADIQRAALPDLVRLVDSDLVEIRRADVAGVMARRGRDLDRAPFPTAACRSCAKRTGAQADFFGGVEAGRLGRCMDGACFSRCWNAVAARRARWAGKRSFRAIRPGQTKGQK